MSTTDLLARELLGQKHSPVRGHIGPRVRRILAELDEETGAMLLRTLGGMSDHDIILFAEYVQLGEKDRRHCRPMLSG